MLFLLVAVGLGLALAATAFLQRRGPGEPAPVAAVEPADAGAVVVAEPADAGAVAVADAGAPDAGTLAAVSPVVDPGALLELFVEPQVDVSVEGRVLGRTPLTVALPPGKHVLYLNNPALGIQTARAVTLSATERNLHQVQLLKGFVQVRAPRGAVILMDGRNVGTAPIEQIDLYEGPHRLLATLNGENWEQAFQLEPHQHVTFTVNFEEP
jgi:serine/threonine-protein kinase